MLSTPLDVVADVFGERPTPEVVVAAERMDGKLARRLLDAGTRWQELASLSPKTESSDLRPYMPDGHPAHTVQFWDPSDSPFWSADQLKHHLLYCHGLVLVSPLVDIARNASYLSPESGRRMLARHVTLLMQLEPLVDAGIVVFVPRFGEAVERDHWMADSDVFRQALNEAMGPIEGDRFRRLVEPLVSEMIVDDYPPSAFSTSRPVFPDLDQLRVQLVFRAYNYIAESLGLILATNGSADVLFAYRHQHQVFRQMVADGAVDQTETSLQAALLSELLNVKLPSLSTLDAGDIVSIRRSESAFEVWRSGLSRSLAALQNLGPDVTDADRRFLIAEELTETATRLRADCERLRIGSLVREASIDFSVGTMGALVGGAVGGSMGTASAAGLVSLAVRQALQKAVQRSRGSSESNATLAHYAVFRERTP